MYICQVQSNYITTIQLTQRWIDSQEIKVQLYFSTPIYAERQYRLAIFVVFLYNKFTMFNQLVSQSMREKTSKRSSISPQITRKSKVIPDEQSINIQKTNSSLQQKQQKIYQTLLRNSHEGRESNNLSQIIKEKLRSKKVQLPRYQTSLEYERGLNDNSFESLRQKIRMDRFENRRYREKIREDLRRFKTEHIYSQLDSQDQNKHIKQAITEIEQLNHSMAQRDRRNAVKPFNLSHQYTPKRKHQDLRDISRRQDFQRYIDHLEKMSLRKMGQQTNHNSPIYLNKFHIQVPPKKLIQQINPVRIERTPPKIVFTQKNESFIKILKKVKARGQSLLVKIVKFPSYKLLKT